LLLEKGSESELGKLLVIKPTIPWSNAPGINNRTWSEVAVGLLGGPALEEDEQLGWSVKKRGQDR